MSNASPPADDEPFFARWSRRKQTVKAAVEIPEDAAPVPGVIDGDSPAAVAARVDQDQPGDTTERTGVEPTGPEPLTEADFADVDFDKLDYASDYGRFTQAGVPENIRQKALTKLWHSDTMFTQVDPYQDYAGDYTDAAAVPLGGIVKTAYKVGQGFLTDDEAHAWDRLGKPALAADVEALSILRPGFRVRRAVAADAGDLVVVQQAAILGQGTAAYGAEIAASWAGDLSSDPFVEALQRGEHLDVALNEETSAIIGFCGTLGSEIKALFVIPRYGRKGIGTLLLRRAEEALKVTGVTQAQLLATRGAKALYDCQGYTLVAERAQATRGGLEMHVFAMTKMLVRPEEVVIAKETPDQTEVRAFFAASEAYMGTLYPAESNHFVDVSALGLPHVAFLVARVGPTAIGCGAVVCADDGTAEIKRMWLDPAARGLKLGARLLAALEAEALGRGVDVLRLETGNAQPEALGLYRRGGFVEIGPFGDYQPDPLSVFMEKRLAAP